MSIDVNMLGLEFHTDTLSLSLSSHTHTHTHLINLPDLSANYCFPIIGDGQIYLDNNIFEGARVLFICSNDAEHTLEGTHVAVYM